MVHARMDAAGITRAKRFSISSRIRYGTNQPSIVVHFFNEGWDFLGDQNDLVDPIRKATNIRREVLRKETSLHDCCVAERMSWAACRKTKRVEDRAYSLFGIFQVHLPMLYGEREAAFQRLQQAILKTSEDDTLFAWTGVSKTYGGLLAPNLEAFRDGALLCTKGFYPLVTVSGAEATERSIGITTKLIPWSIDTYLVSLGCTRRGHEGSGVGIYLRALRGNDSFVRISFSGVDLEYLSFDKWSHLAWLSGTDPRVPYRHDSLTWAVTRSISIRQLPLTMEYHKIFLKEWIYGFRVRILAEEIVPYWENTHWNKETQLMWVDNGAYLDGGIIGTIKGSLDPVTHEQTMAIRDIHFGLDRFFNPVLYIRKKDIPAKSKSIDMFLDPLKFSSGMTKPPSLIEEAQFWTEMRYGDVVDDADRDFWALKGDRREKSCHWYFADMRLSLWVEKTTTDEGLVVWELSLREYIY
jgi:hypothetical protein